MATLETTHETEPPREAWTLGWAFLGGQLLLLAEEGATRNQPVFAALSMLVSAVVVGWFSAGVLTARPVRTFLVGVLCFLSVGFGLLAAIDGSGWVLLQLVASAVQLWAYLRFRRTPYFQEQRARPRPARPPLAGVLGLAVLVGVLGGLTATSDPGGDTQLHVGL